MRKLLLAATVAILAGVSFAHTAEARVFIGGGYYGGYYPGYYPGYYAPYAVYPAPVYYAPAPVYAPAYAAPVAAPPAPSTYYDANSGRYCREYTKKIVVEGAVQESYGTACLQPDGSWHVIN